MGKKTAGDRTIIQGKEKTNEYQRSKRNDTIYAAAYFQKDESGYPLVPLRQQRPILLIGPPGIGKTAINGQIAGRMCGRAGSIYDDPSYKTERHGTSEDRGAYI